MTKSVQQFGCTRSLKNDPLRKMVDAQTFPKLRRTKSQDLAIVFKDEKNKPAMLAKNPEAQMTQL